MDTKFGQPTFWVILDKTIHEKENIVKRECLNGSNNVIQSTKLNLYIVFDALKCALRYLMWIIRHLWRIWLIGIQILTKIDTKFNKNEK